MAYKIRRVVKSQVDFDHNFNHNMFNKTAGEEACTFLLW